MTIEPTREEWDAALKRQGLVSPKDGDAECVGAILGPRPAPEKPEPWKGPGPSPSGVCVREGEVVLYVDCISRETILSPNEARAAAEALNRCADYCEEISDD